jgi:probable F420-dependent oxidoreductase
MPRPFRFDVQSRGAETGRAWRDLARKVESLGYSTLYVPDHFDDMWAPFTAMAVAAEATTTLRVGTLVMANDFRHPVVVAKEAASLDLATEGRVEVGIGAGWLRSDYEQSGIPYDDASVRVRRMEEAIRVMKGVWTTDPFDFAGEFYTVTGARGLPRPHRQPHPTLLIGGGSPRVLRAAGREADVVGVNLNMGAGVLGPEVTATAPAEHFDRRVEWVKEGAGDRFGDIELQLYFFTCKLTDDPRTFGDRLASALGVDPAVVLDLPIVVAGTVDSVCDQLVERRERWGFSSFVFREEYVDSFAPVVERLAGR